MGIKLYIKFMAQLPREYLLQEILKHHSLTVPSEIILRKENKQRNTKLFFQCYL